MGQGRDRPVLLRQESRSSSGGTGSPDVSWAASSWNTVPASSGVFGACHRVRRSIVCSNEHRAVLGGDHVGAPLVTCSPGRSRWWSMSLVPARHACSGRLAAMRRVAPRTMPGCVAVFVEGVRSRVVPRRPSRAWALSSASWAATILAIGPAYWRPSVPTSSPARVSPKKKPGRALSDALLVQTLEVPDRLNGPPPQFICY
jgi:hypothetical protein